MREFFAQSVGSKNVSLENVAMNFCGGWSCFIGKINIQLIGGLIHACPEKNLFMYSIGILFAQSQHNESAPLLLLY